MNEREKEDRSVAKALLAVGIKVASVYDLVNTRQVYKEAIPVLLEFLPIIQDFNIKEGVVRALAVREAKDIATPILIDEFKKLDSTDGRQHLLKWAIGNTLSVVATDKAFDSIASLALDARHGASRQMIALALGNMKKSPVSNVLIQLLDDEEVAGHAIMALGKLKAKDAQKRIEQFLDHPKEWIRKEARRALKKIEK